LGCLIFLSFGYEKPSVLAQARAQERNEAKNHLRLLAYDEKGGSDGAISPNGKYFVISSRRTGNLELWQFEIQTGKWTQLTNDPGEDFEAQWSPDSAQLVFTSTRTGNKDVWILSLKDNSLKQLTFDPEDDEYPNWSPKNNLIVYSGGSWGEREIFMLPASGGEPRKLTNRSGRAGACSFAPEGEYLICHSYESGRGEVFKLSLDGVSAWLTGENTAWDTGGKIAWDYKPTVSPDGKWIAFSRSLDGPTNIWMIDSSGSTPIPLTDNYTNDRWPTWASGNQLFFHRIVDEGAALKVLDRHNGTVRVIVGAENKPGAAAFDPTGQQVVYTVTENKKRGLRIFNLNTGKRSALPTGGKEVNFPRWSPDGRRIACIARQGNRWEIATLNVDGTDMKIWTDKAQSLKGMSGVLDWSPDSTRIVFKADTNPFESDLFILDTTTGKIRNITNDSWFDESPSWTPDGKGIIFMSTRGGNWTWGLYNQSLEDGTVGLVASPDYTEKNFPRMDKQGRVLWSAYGEDGAEYLVEKVKGGKPKLLTAAGSWARWSSSSNDGRFILFTNIKHRVEYWLIEVMEAVKSLSLEFCPIETTLGQTSEKLNMRIKGTTGQAEQMPSVDNPSTIRRSPVNFPHR
jgi:TolB protein